jgi:hypothetical protein
MKRDEMKVVVLKVHIVNIKPDRNTVEMALVEG